MQIDLKNYQELKLKNVVSILKTDSGTYAVAYSKFDIATGEKLPDEVSAVDMNELKKKKEDLQNEIAEIDKFIIDCEAIK